MPVFRTKKEAFEWLKKGEKTIDIRRGKSKRGDTAVYLSGRNVLRLAIVKKQTGMLSEIMRLDNYRLAVPSAMNIEEAVAYLIAIYGESGGTFTAYYVAGSHRTTKIVNHVNNTSVERFC